MSECPACKEPLSDDGQCWSCDWGPSDENGCYICQPDNPEANEEGCSACDREYWASVLNVVASR